MTPDDIGWAVLRMEITKGHGMLITIRDRLLDQQHKLPITQEMLDILIEHASATTFIETAVMVHDKGLISTMTAFGPRYLK